MPGRYSVDTSTAYDQAYNREIGKYRPRATRMTPLEAVFGGVQSLKTAGETIGKGLETYEKYKDIKHKKASREREKQVEQLYSQSGLAGLTTKDSEYAQKSKDFKSQLGQIDPKALQEFTQLEQKNIQDSEKRTEEKLMGTAIYNKTLRQNQDLADEATLKIRKLVGNLAQTVDDENSFQSVKVMAKGYGENIDANSYEEFEQKGLKDHYINVYKTTDDYFKREQARKKGELEQQKFDYEKEEDIEEKLKTGGVPKETFEQERKLAKEFQSLNKDFVKIKDSFRRVSTAASGEQTPAGDIALVFNFMKILDANSVVRESEYKTAAAAAAVRDKAMNLMNKINKGYVLTPKQRQDFQLQAGRMFGALKVGYNESLDNYNKISDQYGLDPKRVTGGLYKEKIEQGKQEFEELKQPTKQDMKSGTVIEDAGSGKKYRFLGGDLNDQKNWEEV